jgi:hypothetical protein
MSQSRVTHQSSGRKGFYSASAFVPAKSGRDLFNEGAPLSACLTKNQADEWKAAEAEAIEGYLAEEAAKTIELRRSLAYLDACQLEGMPAASVCAVLC